MQKILHINLYVPTPIFNIYVKGPYFCMSVETNKRPSNSHCPIDRDNPHTASMVHSTNHVITFVTFVV